MPSELQPETEYYSKVNKWNTFIVNLNGIKNGFLRNGHSRSHNIPNGAATDKPTAAEKDISPPYIVAHPSFEMGWPRPSTGGMRTLTNGSASSMTSASAAVQIPAFQLTSHKQLEHADQIDTMEEESDESPPYLPTTTPQNHFNSSSAAVAAIYRTYSKDVVVEKPV